MAVNITPAQLRNPNFVKKVLRILRNNGLTAPQLELEIIESSILEPDSRTLDMFTTLNASIHAPARGATPADQGALRIRWRFNPRSRTGSDPGCNRPLTY